jgi:hypothetical protein
MMPRPRLQEEFVYHPPELKKVVSPTEKVLQAVLVAVVGTGLGIGVGVFLAGRTVPPDTSAAASPTPAVATTSGISLTKTPAKTTIETKPQAAPTTPPDSSRSATDARLVAKAVPVTPLQTANQTHQPRLIGASLTGIRTGFRHRHGLRHKTTLGAIKFPKRKTPALVEEAKLEIPDGRFRFTIEGDQTAVAYDAQSGVVSTDGAGMFVVERVPGEIAQGRVQETPTNIHYKCDQDANCSLVMASLVVPHARMRSVSHTTDWAYVPVSTDGQIHDGSQAPVYFGHVSR